MREKLLVKTSGSLPGKTDMLVIFSADGNPLQNRGKTVFEQTGMNWKALTGAAEYKGQAGQHVEVLLPDNLAAKRLIVFGAGALDAKSAAGEKKALDFGTRTYWERLGGKLVALLERTPGEKATLIMDEKLFDSRAIAQMVAGMHLRHYRFDKYKTEKSGDNTASDERTRLAVTLRVKGKSGVDKRIDTAMAIVQGTILARNLVHEPPNVLGPEQFAHEAKALQDFGVKVEILDEEKLEKLGMGALLAVAKGSVRPARMAVMKWNGGGKSQQPVALVGKGVVFDTGGISIKPAGSMQDMKADMGGAAAVTGLMKAAALRKAKCNIVGVIGLVENMPDGEAYRPGDIITAMSGTTVEIVNTDAEGRLVLADLLWYAQQTFKPGVMINLATLTGAIMVALGQDYAGLFANDDRLASQLSAAGEVSGEKLWRMPMGVAYDRLIKSRFADIKNSGGRFGGAITAAQFLQKFVRDVPWAHLDIAGVGFASPASDTNRAWASGFGVAVLDQFLQDNYEKDNCET